MIDFEPFPKVPRLSRECVITEKIDGTNASIWILDPKKEGVPKEATIVTFGVHQFAIVAGSRTRFLTPEKDNAGFARWVWERAEALVLELGYGTHYGEWWGSGIQRRYGLTGTDKRFSLFNVARWADDPCLELCSVVPTLYQGPFDTYAVHRVLGALGVSGSKAAPGFPHPEGVMIYHTAARHLFKKTFVGDEGFKSDASV